MSDNVVKFPDVVLQPGEMLQEAREEGMRGVIILGFKEEGDDYLAVSNLTTSECIYLAELLKGHPATVDSVLQEPNCNECMDMHACGGTRR